jgi:hypothetical protein
MIDAGLDDDHIRPVRRPAAASVAVLDVIDVGQHEPTVEKRGRVLQVLRNSGTAQPSCPESFIALAEHVSISPSGRHRLVDLERRPAHGLGTVQLRAEARHATHLAEGRHACLFGRDHRPTRISFRLSITITLDPPGGG